LELYDIIFRSMPLWFVFVLTVLIVLLSVYIGYRLGKFIRHRSKDGGEIFAGSVVAASLGLLAFMLAFTFSIAANRFSDRKQLLLDEVNTIGTTYLRADFLPDPTADETKKLLREYVDLRVSLAEMGMWKKPENIQELINRSESIQGKLWANIVPVGIQNPDSEIIGLFISSLNEVIDLQTERVVVALQYHIPGTIWGALYLLSILAFGLVGYELGAVQSGSVLVSIIMAITFSTVILLITDLDRPLQGHIMVSQEPMIQLQQKLNLDAR